MPEIARCFDEDRFPDASVRGSAPASPWHGDVHGEVGAMHRTIEERMLAGADMQVVLPMTARPAETLVEGVSRAAGWAALGGGFAVAAMLLLR